MGEKSFLYSNLVKEATNTFLKTPACLETQNGPLIAMTTFNAAYITLQNHDLVGRELIIVNLSEPGQASGVKPKNRLGKLLEKITKDVQKNDPKYASREAVRRTMFPHQNKSGYC